MPVKVIKRYDRRSEVVLLTRNDSQWYVEYSGNGFHHKNGRPNRLQKFGSNKLGAIWAYHEIEREMLVREAVSALGIKLGKEK